MNNQLSEINKSHINLVRDKINEYNIKWSEGSIDFVLNSLNKSFEDTVEYSDENLKIIIMCGLPDHSREKALNFIGELRKQGITYRETHQILVKILKEDNFFMDGDSRENYLNLIASLMML